jgi:hypothetical protein
VANEAVVPASHSFAAARAHNPTNHEVRMSKVGIRNGLFSFDILRLGILRFCGFAGGRRSKQECLPLLFSCRRSDWSRQRKVGQAFLPAQKCSKRNAVA